MANIGQTRLRQASSITRLLPYLLFFITSVCVLGSSLSSRGFIFRLDMVFSPHTYFKFDGIEAGYALHHSIVRDSALQVVNFTLPMDIAQKLMLVGVFFIAMYSVYTTLRIPSQLARVSAAMLYGINPFTYDRLMAGHWWFLLGYSLMPFLAVAIERFMAEPFENKNALRVLIWWTVVTLLSTHHLLLGAILFLALSSIHIRSIRITIRALGLVATFLLLQLWWLIPAASNSLAAQTLDNSQFYAFASRADLQHGIWFTLLSLQGFWSTDWSSLKDLYTQWSVLIAAWLMPVVTGIAAWATYAVEERRRLVSYGLLGAVALILAAGPHPPVGDINFWLFSNVPGFSGMRESQKFLSLLVLTYVLFSAYGLQALIRRSKHIGTFFTVLSIGVVLLVGKPLLFGANGQLQAQQYPESWQTFKSILESESRDTTAVVLPWNLYTDDTFTGNLHANPARAFFGPKILQSQQANVSGVTNIVLPGTADIELADDTQDARLLRDALRSLKAEYVIVTQSGAIDYDWLFTSDLFTVVLSDEHLSVFSLTKKQ